MTKPLAKISVLVSFGAEHQCIVPRAAHACTRTPSSRHVPGAAGLPRTHVHLVRTPRACMYCVRCRRGLQEAPLDLSLNPTSDPNPNPNPDPNRGQVLGQQGLPSTPLELRRCLFLCSTALHCAAAASRCACTYYTAPTPPAPPHAAARPRTPPHAPEAARLPSSFYWRSPLSPPVALAVLVRAETTLAARTHATLPPRLGRCRVRRHMRTHAHAQTRARRLWWLHTDSWGQ